MSTSTVPAAAQVTESRSARLGRVLAVEVRDELRAIVREPAAIGFSVLMPVVFFALFVTIFDAEGADPAATGTRMLAAFGTFGVLSVTLMNPGISLAADRERGWLRVTRVAAVPFPVTVAAKVLAAVPYSIGVMGAMTLTAAAMGRLDVTAPGLVRMVLALVVGATVFVPIGLAVGSVASSNATAAILNAILLPMAIASGLWMPLEVLPDWIAGLAPVMPAHHLQQLATAQLTAGGGAAGSALVLGTTFVLGAGVFAAAYRRSWP